MLEKANLLQFTVLFAKASKSKKPAALPSPRLRCYNHAYQNFTEATLKKNELVNIEFTHNGHQYLARVQKFSPTAIILPNQTVLVTTCVVHKNKKMEDENQDVERNRQIFDGKGSLLPLTVLHQPGDWNHPLDIHFPIIFANPK